MGKLLSGVALLVLFGSTADARCLSTKPPPKQGEYAQWVNGCGYPVSVMWWTTEGGCQGTRPECGDTVPAFGTAPIVGSGTIYSYECGKPGCYPPQSCNDATIC
jgi:hypothetical protein